MAVVAWIRHALVSETVVPGKKERAEQKVLTDPGMFVAYNSLSEKV